MVRDVSLYVKRCHVCRVGRGKSSNVRKYLLLPKPENPSIDISMDIVMGLHHTTHGSKAILWLLIDSLKWLTLLLVG